MYKFTTHSKQFTFLIIGFVVLIAIIATGVVRGASEFGPTAGAPDGNVSIECAEGEFVKGVGANASCANPLAGIPNCENGLLYNDPNPSTPTVPLLKCYDFLEGSTLTNEAGYTIIEELSCNDALSPIITEIQWNAAEKKFKVICSSKASLPGEDEANSPVQPEQADR